MIFNNTLLSASKFIKYFSLAIVVALSACTGSQIDKEPTARMALRSDPKTLDPAHVEDYYSAHAVGPVYEGLLEYEYLKRPHELKPLLAEEMPTVSKNGLVYTFKIKKGVKFHDSEAFEGGKGRSLTAHDFVYSFMRVADPKEQSGMFWVFDGHIKGLNKWRDSQKGQEATDYSLPVEGLKALDDHTLQITLAHKYPQLLYVLAMPAAAAVPIEAVQKFGKDFVNNPVGTGPFVFKQWMRGSKLVYEKNPSYSHSTYPTMGDDGDQEQGRLADAGKQLPLVDKFEILILTESQPRWLNFMNGTLDVVEVPKDNYDAAIDRATNTLKKEFVDKGIGLFEAPELDVTYIAFNQEDPFIKKAGPKFRQALSLAVDQKKTIDLFYNGLGVLAQSPVPPGIAGYDPDYVNPYAAYNVEKAKQLLAEAGFPGGKGVPELVYDIGESSDSRQMAEKLQAEFAAIGVKVQINVNRFAELIEKLNTKKSQMWGIAWLGDYPDAENFLQLLYGKNKAPGPNAANFDKAEYNKLFEQVRGMADSPERRKIIRKMQDIYVKHMPWIVGAHRTVVSLAQPWTKNYKPGYMGSSFAKFLNVDLEDKNKRME